jgi:hypothetical protein
MKRFDTLVLVTSVVTALTASACANEVHEDDTSTAPTASLDTLEDQDQGTSYNGWAQISQLMLDYCWPSEMTLWHELKRTSGDASRGGGGCYVRRTTTSCSSDSTCTSMAQAQYGASAYGYCYSGTCYNRPGSQANLCSMAPQRVPNVGTSHVLWRSVAVAPPVDGNDFMVGCMTKTAGPNTACGGTNSSLYMRSMDPMLTQMTCL